MNATFRIGLAGNFRTEWAGMLEPALKEQFDPLPFLQYEYMPEPKGEVLPGEIKNFDAVITTSIPFTATTLRDAERLVTIARWGVGYDTIDVRAATENNVLLSNTPAAVRRPMAEGIMALLLSLTRQLQARDRLVRVGKWNEKGRYIGVGLAGRTLGSIGLGSIATELCDLLAPFRLKRLLAYDPYISSTQAPYASAELVALETLLTESDFICINCQLTPETHHLIGERQLRQMKPTALLINTARGPIVDQVALTRALAERWIAGAALDVFEHEPLQPDDPLVRLDNVLLSPHSIGVTDQLIRDNGTEACHNALAILRGEIPSQVVNREILKRPGFQHKLKSLKDRWNRR